MQIRIEARNLPGRNCGAGPNFPGYRNIHVGIQRRDQPRELLDLHPGDAPTAKWTLDCTPTPTPTGIDLKGRYIQNRLGGRFIYLSWVSVSETGQATMFRRAKLMFDAITPETITAATKTGLLTARLSLTNAKGQPLCAHVRPPLVEWSAEPAE